MAVVYREFNADLLYRNAVPLRSLIADTNTAARRFYIYEGRDLDFGYLASCAGYDTLLWSAHARLAAEVGLYHVLKSHPRRTRDPKVAMLFYVPVFEYMSFKLANLCGGNSSHGERMRAASAALHASPHWQASGGRDHFVLSTAFNHPTSIVTRTLPLSKALRCSMAGRYKSFSLAYPRSAKSSWGVCAIEAPYVLPSLLAFAELLGRIETNGRPRVAEAEQMRAHAATLRALYPQVLAPRLSHDDEWLGLEPWYASACGADWLAACFTDANQGPAQ